MTLQEQAHEYQIAGLQTIPTYNKAPSGVGETNYLNEYKDSDFIDQYFVGAKQMGVVCGEVSGNLVCFDFDQHGETQNVLPTFDAFIADPVVKHLINTKQAALYSSQSGGRHLYVRTPETERPKVLSKYTTGDVMIELRGQGQYMICWPSPGYEHIGGAELIMVNEIDDEAFLHMIELAISFSEIPIEQNTSEREDVERKWGEKWDVNTPDGKYNIEEGQTAYRLLMDAGWTEIEHRRRGNLRYLTRPGKDPREGISATWGYRKNMLYVFSSSVGDFPIPHNNIGKAFNPFDILVRYEYQGDWRKAKDSLRELYGMKSVQKVQPLDPVEEKRIMDVTPFPLEVFPDMFRNIILQMQSALNFSPDITACAMMSTISSIAGNAIKVRVKNGWETPMIFWFIIRGLPGTNKSHPVNMMVRPLKNLNKSYYDDYLGAMMVYNGLDEKEKARHPKPAFKQVLVDDLTVESLRSVLTINPRGVMLHNDEIKKFIDSMNQYKGGGGSDESFWLTSFNNDGFTVNRVKSEPVVIDKIFINIIGTIQPDVLTDILSKQKNNGFIDRFLFSRSEKYAHGLNDVEVPDSVFNLWNDYCYNLNKSYQYDEEQYYLSEFTPKAKEYHIEIANSYAKMQNDESNTMTMRSYISKLRVYIPRFALFFSFIDHTDPHVGQPSLDIEVHHLERAKKVCDYFLATAEEVFVENVEKSEAKTVDPKKGTNQERIAAMLEKNIAQKVIAETIGVSKAYVSKIKKQLENG